MNLKRMIFIISAVAVLELSFIIALSLCVLREKDTNVVDTNVADTDVADTDVIDTDVADTDVVDTDVVDTNIVDTDVVDTNVTDEVFDEFQRYLQEKKLSEYESMDFTFIEEQRLNNPLSASNTVWPSDKSRFWWEELPSIGSVHRFETTYDASVPIIDMGKNTIIVSFWRKIEKLRYFRSDHYPQTNNIVASVTFSKEFFENTAFYYTVNREVSSETTFVFVPSWLMSPCYIIQEEERYLGPHPPFQYPK